MKHLDESVLFYRPTKTLIVCDTAFHFTEKTIVSNKEQPVAIQYAKKVGIYNKLGRLNEM